MIVTAVNTSPRPNWNTAQLVKAAADGAARAGAEIRYFDLYKQEKFTGCISCFGCKREPNEGKCICRDGIFPILEAIRESDAVIIGTPNYLGQPSAGFHALYERLAFQNITYRKEDYRYREPDKRALFIMTSNMPEERYAVTSYGEMVEGYRQALSGCIGPTEVLISGNTLQISNYDRYNWTMFDIEGKKQRHETIFPKELEKAARAGAALLGK